MVLVTIPYPLMHLPLHLPLQCFRKVFGHLEKGKVACHVPMCDIDKACGNLSAPREQNELLFLSQISLFLFFFMS